MVVLFGEWDVLSVAIARNAKVLCAVAGRFSPLYKSLATTVAQKDTISHLASDSLDVIGTCSGLLAITSLEEVLKSVNALQCLVRNEEVAA